MDANGHSGIFAIFADVGFLHFWSNLSSQVVRPILVGDFYVCLECNADSGSSYIFINIL